MERNIQTRTPLTSQTKFATMKNVLKLIVLLILFTSISNVVYSQKKPSKNLPPIKMLPKNGEVKHIYELSQKFEYKVFDVKGELMVTGNAQFIDYTEYKKGVYFIHFKKKIEKFEKK